MNPRLFRSIMILHDDTNKSLAEFLGVSEQTICNKINENGTEFKQSEISKIAARYTLDADAVMKIFFN